MGNACPRKRQSTQNQFTIVSEIPLKQLQVSQIDGNAFRKVNMVFKSETFTCSRYLTSSEYDAIKQSSDIVSLLSSDIQWEHSEDNKYTHIQITHVHYNTTPPEIKQSTQSTGGLESIIYVPTAPMSISFKLFYT